MEYGPHHKHMERQIFSLSSEVIQKQIDGKMRFEDFFHAVYKALEHSYLLTEVELVKDYSNLCLILKPTKIVEESLTETLTQWRKETERIGDPNADIRGHEGVRGATIAHGTETSVPRQADGIEKSSVMKYEDSIHFDQEDFSEPSALEKDAAHATLHPDRSISVGNAMSETPKSLLADFRPDMLPTLVRTTENGTSFAADLITADASNGYQPVVNSTALALPGQTGENLICVNKDNSDPVAPAGEQQIVKPIKKNAKKLKKVSSVKVIKKKFACTFCPFECDQIDSLQNHMSVHGAKPYKCTSCNYKCKSSLSLIQHLRVHTGEKPFKCDACDFETGRNSNLRAHKLTHESEKRYRCQYCDYSAKFLHSVQNHEKVMHLNACALFRCNLCSFRTLHDIRRLAHIRAHEQNIFYTCNICEKIIWDARDFKYHLRKHKSKPMSKNVPCPECGEKFFSTERLKSHMFHHTGKMEYKCRICGSDYRTFRSMLNHCRKHHPNDAVFNCQQCNFYTNSLREYHRHPSTVTHMEKIKSAEILAIA